MCKITQYVWNNTLWTKLHRGSFRVQYGTIPLTWKFLHWRRRWRQRLISGMPKCIFAKCIRLACLLSFASLLFTLPTISHFKYPLWHWTLSRYKHFWANDHKLITYDRLITDHTNGEYLGNFDVEAGTFTAGTPGSLSQYLWTTHILVKTGQYSVDFSSSVPYNTLNDYIEVLGRKKDSF